MTHMQHSFENIEYLIGSEEILQSIASVSAKNIFDNRIMEMLADWSEVLLKHPSIRINQDVAAFAFWIRKKSLIGYKEDYIQELNRLGRGLAFQIAPSNIPVQFAVTMVYALLSGNATVIRVSGKQFQQVDILCTTLNQLLIENYNDLRKYIVVIRYDHTHVMNQWLSEICDIRIIWGGNTTIQAIRRYNISPRTIELAFADRYSIAVVNADKYLQCNADSVANMFYMDTYYVDQNACSSPRMVIWYGKQVAEAQNLFWEKLQCVVDEKYTFQPISATDKLLQFCLLAAETKGVYSSFRNNKIIRVKVNSLDPEIMRYKGNSGYFYEYIADDLDDVINMLSKECQTVDCLGVDKEQLRKYIQQKGVKGGDRIVDLGHTLDLSLVWDGYDMIRELSRIVQI